MNFQIRHRYSSAVLFECELSADIAEKSYGLKLGFSVQEALKSKANLCRADLSWANLSWANLSKADLSWANLSGANLSKADLSEADLSEADLSGADLSGADLSEANLSGANLCRANLSGANLSWADLSEADLSWANLSGANLSKADLSGANLSGANLCRANLSGANLSEANLSKADLSVIKNDLISEVLRLPNELDALRAAIVSGNIDGSTYSGKCACLAGTLAKARHEDDYNGDNIAVAPGVVFHASAYSPREKWFTAIRPGDTPDKNPAAKIALEWVDEAIAIRDLIRSSARQDES